MEKILFKSPTIVIPGSEFYNKEADVLVADGKIEAIASNLEIGDAVVVQGKGKFLSTGFFDLNANLSEPGFETREDLASGVMAAAAGGFTGLAMQPNTEPPVQSKAEVSYIINQTRKGIVDVFPLGCISHNREGKDIAEFFDMKTAGAIGFTDGTRPVTDSGLMSRALLYANGIDALILSFPEDPAIAGKGKMNEGETSTYLGMKGIPSLAEELMVSRDLYLADYNNARIHFSTISTAGSVALIKEAKSKGLKVSCDVAAHHLVLTDKALEAFDSNYKVKPPFRTDEDRRALIEGLKDGTIDAIVSQHSPFEIEYKDVEFEIASFGTIGLQTALPLCLKAGMSIDKLIEKLVVGPRKVLNLPVPANNIGDSANLILIDINSRWVFNAESNKSKSANSPFFNQELTGKVEYVLNNKKFLKL